MSAHPKIESKITGPYELVFEWFSDGTFNVELRSLDLEEDFNADGKTIVEALDALERKLP